MVQEFKRRNKNTMLHKTPSAKSIEYATSCGWLVPICFG